MRSISVVAGFAVCAVSACLPAFAAPPGGIAAFNPGIGFIMQGTYGSYASSAGNRQIPGFLLGDDTGLILSTCLISRAEC